MASDFLSQMPHGSTCATAATAAEDNDMDALLGRLLTPLNLKEQDRSVYNSELEYGDDVDDSDEIFWAWFAGLLAFPVCVLYSVVTLFLGTYSHWFVACRRHIIRFVSHLLSWWQAFRALACTSNHEDLKLPPSLPRKTSIGANSKAGLHWCGLGDVCERDDHVLFSSLFDPSKPSVIYVHGYQPRTTIRKFRESLNWNDNDVEYGLDMNAADHWLKAGWNVGVFYWASYADEDYVHDAEAKIWSNATRVGMRYRLLTQCGTGVKWRYVSSSVPCASEQLAAVLQRRFLSGTESYRLVGHSLGAQVVIHTATLLAQAKRKEEEQQRDRTAEEIKESDSDGNSAQEISTAVAPMSSISTSTTASSSSSPSTPTTFQASFMLPSRIALLDAYFTLEPKRYLGWRSLASVLKEEITALAREEDVVFEQYQTSLLSFAASLHLKPLTAFFNVDPKHIPWWKLRARHVCAPYLYFHSMASREVGRRVMKEVGGAWTDFWGEVLGQDVLEDEDSFRGMAMTPDAHLRLLIQACGSGGLWEHILVHVTCRLLSWW
eukprot:evm.model.NODE_7157_length_17160_cov_22.777040.7